MRIVVTGGIDFNDKEFVWTKLDELHTQNSITLLAHGACPVGTGGVDILAENWAKHNEVPYLGLPAQFSTGKKGRSEGPIRNTKLLKMIQPNLVLAFPGGRGTSNCIKQALDMGIRVIEVSP